MGYSLHMRAAEEHYQKAVSYFREGKGAYAEECIAKAVKSMRSEVELSSGFTATLNYIGAASALLKKARLEAGENESRILVNGEWVEIIND